MDRSWKRRTPATRLRTARAATLWIAVWGIVVMSASAQMPDRILVDFGDPRDRERWQIVNDGVMGGRSRSTLTIQDDSTAVFEGSLSLANYGGFASVRTAPGDYSLAGFDGLLLRAKGDGRTYQLRMQTDGRFEGVAYRAMFDTEPDTWMIHRISLRSLVPTFRGRVLADVPPLDPAEVRRIGFLIGDKRAGPFRLQVDWVGAYRDVDQ